ncbi:MAG TPA: hypothetical protein VEF76_14050 [Patescibacteria group bacterium]|nr:hypothetical protein [Patescibacteria group bacterium]
MQVPRLHTMADADPLKGSHHRIHQDGDFSEYAVPAGWGRSAAEVLVDQVFCKKPIPALLKPVPENGVPQFLWRREADDAGLDGISAEWRYRSERDFRECFARIAGGLTYHGWKAGLFDGEEDARAFYDEFRFMMLQQIALPEIALLAAAGLDWAYGLDAGFVPAARIDGYSDALFGHNIEGAGIAVATDAPEKNILRRLKALGERQALDGAARKISVTLPVENADSPFFVALKRQSDIAAVAQEVGGKTLEAALHHVMDACDRESVFGFDPEHNLRLRQAMADARRAGVPEAPLRMAIHAAQQGAEEIDLFTQAEEQAPPQLSTTLSVPDEFIESALTNHGFLLKESGEAKRHFPAEKLWNAIADAVWATGEPALFFRDSAAAASAFQANAPLAASGQGGVIFLHDTAAPAATLQLMKCAGRQGGLVVDAEKLQHAVKLLVIALEASYSFARLPEKSVSYRPVSIGLSGLSALLMSNMLPYDSEQGRATAALVTALVSGAAHEVSAQLAVSAGPFAGFAPMKREYLQAVKDKMSALAGTSYMQKGLSRRPAELKSAFCPDQALVDAAKNAWARAYVAGKETGFRHAHLTAMETDAGLQALLGGQTRDIAPEASLVRFEGYFADGNDAAEIYGKKLNPMAAAALQKMGFNAQERDAISFYAVGHGTLLDAPGINHAALKRLGFHQAALDALEVALRTAQHIRYAFNKWTLGEDFCRHMLGFSASDLAAGTFDMLTALRFTEDEIEEANLYCCGAMTLEGAPHLHPKQLGIFDCLTPAGSGIRRVSPEAQLRMQAAVEPFLSGTACHTVELGHYASVEEVQKLLLLGWELGVKRLQLYRDACSLLHPVALPVAENIPTLEEEAERAITPLRRRLKAMS